MVNAVGLAIWWLFPNLSRIHTSFMRGISNVRRYSTSAPELFACRSQSSFRLDHSLHHSNRRRRWYLWDFRCISICLSKIHQVSIGIHWFLWCSMGGGLGIACRSVANHRSFRVGCLIGRKGNRRCQYRYQERPPWSALKLHPRTAKWYEMC